MQMKTYPLENNNYNKNCPLSGFEVQNEQKLNLMDFQLHRIPNEYEALLHIPYVPALFEKSSKTSAGLQELALTCLRNNWKEVEQQNNRTHLFSVDF